MVSFGGGVCVQVAHLAALFYWSVGTGWSFNHMRLKAARAGKWSHLAATELTAEGGWVSYILTAFSFWLFSDSLPTLLSPWKCIQSFYQTFSWAQKSKNMWTPAFWVIRRKKCNSSFSLFSFSCQWCSDNIETQFFQMLQVTWKCLILLLPSLILPLIPAEWEVGECYSASICLFVSESAERSCHTGSSPSQPWARVTAVFHLLKIILGFVCSVECFFPLSF